MNKINLPVIILKGMILLPNNDLRLDLVDEVGKNIISEAELFHDNKILVVSKNNPLEETTNASSLPRYGVIVRCSHKIILPNGNFRVTLTALSRAIVDKYLNSNEDGSLESLVTSVNKVSIDAKDEVIYIGKLKRELENYSNTIPYVSNSVLSQIANITSLDDMTDIIVPYLQMELIHLEEYLYEFDPIKRASMILKDIYNEIEVYGLEKQIDDKVKKSIDEREKNFLLHEKIKAIKEELGDITIKDSEYDEIRNKIDYLKAPDKIKERLKHELAHYEALTISSPELNIIRSYIDWLLDLPWLNYTIDNDDLLDVRSTLDNTHHGIDDVKNRIIEYLAVKQMTNSLRGPIICLVGPPGVGKTSLAFSIAKAMHRNFVKISVGGINDEAELIGHRRTYLGASPGRIIQSLKKAKSSNPVFLIDEIDKMTKNYNGDPASVLLEILDPEQNKLFSDNYIEEEYDLSKILFITTANYIDDIPEALKDRLEIVELSGYTEFEKIDIAKNHLIPKICKEHGINPNGVIFKGNVIKKIIREYTKEAGVRELERKLATVIRKIVTSIVEKRVIMNKYIIDDEKIIEFLGKPKYTKNNEVKSGVGICNGLAYTSYGGDVLPIEASIFKGSGKLILTGSLGDVMKESASIALSYIKSNYKLYNIDYDMLMNNDIHIHVPEGAIKKEGPSAGIALTTALISIFKNKKVNKNIAFTGEITLFGDVLKIGGLKEKSIGAFRSGIKRIIIPNDNLNDLDLIPNEIKDNIEFISIKNYKELIDILWK